MIRALVTLVVEVIPASSMVVVAIAVEAAVNATALAAAVTVVVAAAAADSCTALRSCVTCKRYVAFVKPVVHAQQQHNTL